MESFADGAFSRRSAKDFPVRDRQIVEIDADAQISVSSCLARRLFVLLFVPIILPKVLTNLDCFFVSSR